MVSILASTATVVETASIGVVTLTLIVAVLPALIAAWARVVAVTTPTAVGVIFTVALRVAEVRIVVVRLAAARGSVVVDIVTEISTVVVFAVPEIVASSWVAVVVVTY